MTRLEDVRSLLATSIATTAAWRRDNAIAFPNDRRNLEAADLLNQLATTLPELDDRSLEILSTAYNSDNVTYDLVVIESDILSEVGFSRSPTSASDFVNALIEAAARRAGSAELA